VSDWQVTPLVSSRTILHLEVVVGRHLTTPPQHQLDTRSPGLRARCLPRALNLFIACQVLLASLLEFRCYPSFIRFTSMCFNRLHSSFLFPLQVQAPALKGAFVGSVFVYHRNSSPSAITGRADSCIDHPHRCQWPHAIRECTSSRWVDDLTIAAVAAFKSAGVEVSSF
jgi:hypothetical protein